MLNPQILKDLWSFSCDHRQSCRIADYQNMLSGIEIKLTRNAARFVLYQRQYGSDGQWIYEASVEEQCQCPFKKQLESQPQYTLCIHEFIIANCLRMIFGGKEGKQLITEGMKEDVKLSLCDAFAAKIPQNVNLWESGYIGNFFKKDIKVVYES